MFELTSTPSVHPALVDSAELTAMIARLSDAACVDNDAERIDQIRLLETLKCAAAGLQARLTAEFASSREIELSRIATESVRDRARRDIAAQVGLARRVSPTVGARLVGLAKILSAEMPALHTALRGGDLDEYQALLVASETATLTREHRRAVDDELAARYGSMTPRQARGAAARIGYRLDPEQAVRRAALACRDRRVTLRPAPDTMTYLTALLPAVEGVAAFAALTHSAATATAHGDPRGQGALMADTLVSRLTRPGADETGSSHTGSVGMGPTATAEDATALEASTGAGLPGAVARTTDGLRGVPAGVHVEIQLVMTDRTLFDGDSEPALLTGYGPIPAPLARHLVAGADPRTRTWVRRLFTDPGGGPTRADPRRRYFSPTDRRFLVARDQACRTPWCGAPIRHADHTRRHADGGTTESTNGAGLCVACNLTKEFPGWRSETRPDGEVVTTTPTGHHYRSRPFDLPRSAPWEGQVPPPHRKDPAA